MLFTIYFYIFMFTKISQDEKVPLSLIKEAALHRLCKRKRRNIRLFTIEDMYQ